MKPLNTMLLTASLAMAFFVTTDTRAFAQMETQVPRFEEEVIVTTPPPVIKGSARDHFLSFNVPVAVPGVTLGPGSYIFRRPFDSAGRVIQILSADRRHVYAMYHMWPAFRSKVTGRDAVVLAEARAGSPLRILEWYEGNNSLGYAFPWRKTALAETTAVAGTTAETETTDMVD